LTVLTIAYLESVKIRTIIYYYISISYKEINISENKHMLILLYFKKHHYYLYINTLKLLAQIFSKIEKTKKYYKIFNP